jgi:hypothetical protein
VSSHSFIYLSGLSFSILAHRDVATKHSCCALFRRFLDKANESSGPKYNNCVVKLYRWDHARWIQGLYPLPLPAATMFLDVDLAREPNSNTMLDHERTTKTAMPVMREHGKKCPVGTIVVRGRVKVRPLETSSPCMLFHRMDLYVESICDVPWLRSRSTPRPSEHRYIFTAQPQRRDESTV